MIGWLTWLVKALIAAACAVASAYALKAVWAAVPQIVLVITTSAVFFIVFGVLNRD